MRIAEVVPREGGTLYVVSEDGRAGVFDVRPYLTSEAFVPLNEWAEFARIRNGRYYVAWQCGADLSADTIEARWTTGAMESAQSAASADVDTRR
jgi:hypothetical protein